MEFAEVIRRRRMVRDYDPDRPVPAEVVERLLAHAVRAPSAGFSQGWAFLVLSEPEDRRLFWSVTAPGRAAASRPAPEPTCSAGGEPCDATGSTAVTASTAHAAPARPGPPDHPAGKQTAWLSGMSRAPLIIVPMSSRSAYLDRYAEPDKGWNDRDEARWPVPYWHIDTGFAALLIMLTAVDEGLGACFFGIPAERTEAFRAAFSVPDDHSPIGAMTIGYRAPDRPSPSLRRGRRPVEQVAHYGRW